MGGSKTTQTTKVTQTPEEKEFTRQQIELAKQQLALTEEQHGWQSEIFALTKPLLEKYSLLVGQQYDDYNSPAAVALRDRYSQLESAQLDQQLQNIPLQNELLQHQLDEIRRGGRATDEQKALIGEIADRAIQTGTSDIGNFLETGLRQVREELAPARGLRPTDAPIIDQGGRLAMEALRQGSQLTSQVRGAQANAELNFPLNASQVYGAQTQFQQGLQQQINAYLSQLRENANQNRNQFTASLFQAPMAAGEQGVSLINASRPTPISFPRDSTTTTKQSGGLLGGVGGLLSGIGSLSGFFSARQAKQNIRPIEAPPGHILSPGMIKRNISPLSPWSSRQRMPYNDSGGGSPSAAPGLGIASKPQPIMAVDPVVWGQGAETKQQPIMSVDPRVWGEGLGPPKTQPTMSVDPVVWGQGAETKTQPTMSVDPRVWGEGLESKQQPSFQVSPPRTEEDTLNRIAQLPVSTWQYKPAAGLGSDTHVGPMAEDFNTQIMGKQPQPFINTADAVGSLMASVKALEKRTRKTPYTRGRR